MIGWQDRLEGACGRAVDLYFTDAVGGVQAGPYAGFNLGGHVGDDPAVVARNREELAQHVGVAAADVVWMNQVHGAQVWQVGAQRPPSPECDAVVTQQAGLALAVLVADCTPVLLADVQAGLVAAAHAGRPGLVAGVVPAAVERMRALGAQDIRAYVGPSVCGRCYEVPEEMRAEVAERTPSARTVSWSGTPAVDVAAGVVEQLDGLNVAVTWVPGCTREDPALFSYRREQRTGRFAGLVVLRPGADDEPDIEQEAR